jgi:outer membrane lipoprotein-sorting protein
MARAQPSLWPGLLAAAFALFWLPAAHADEIDARAVIERVESLLWAKTMQGEFEMSIVTPRWRRTLELRVAIERPTRSFIRVRAPAKEAGIGSLRIGAEMWNYLPNIERTIKIPPSMMLQPWMGSDFTNDDLVKASNAVNDYTHKTLRTETIEGAPVLVIEAVPKPDAAVVWGRILYWVRSADFVPLKEEFYSERGELVRVMTFTDVRPLGGRIVPTRWEIRPQAKPDNATVVVLKSAVYDQPIDTELFTQRNLQKP